MKKTVAFLTALCLIITAFSGCALFDKGTGKDFYYPIYSDTESFDPQIANDEASLIVAENCFEGLVKYDKDGNIVPGVAKSWDISSDGLTYTFHLDPEAKWHIGDDALEVLSDYSKGDFNNKVMAEDFVFALRRYFDPETKTQPDSRLYLIKNASDVSTGSKSPSQLGISAIDAETLQINLENQSDTFLSSLTTGATKPCREEFFLATKGRYGLSTKYLICNGAFYLSFHSDGVFVQMTKNDEYKNADEVYPSNVFLYINSSRESRLNKLETGVYDACPIDVESKLSISEKKISYLSYVNSVWTFCFNCSSEIFSNEDMRGAVCRSIDVKTLEIPEYASGYSNGFVPKICMIGEKSYRSLVGDAAFLPYDGETARNLFESGLKTLGKENVDVTLLCPTDLENGMRKLVQHWQKNLGMDFRIRIEPLKVDEINERIALDDYDIAFTCLSASFASASDFLSSFSENGEYMVFNYASLSYNDAITEISYSFNSVEMAKKCLKAENILLQSAVTYPVFDEELYLALGKGVSGVFLTQAGTIPIFASGKRVD